MPRLRVQRGCAPLETCSRIRCPRKNRLAVKLGLTLFGTGILVGLSGLVLIQLEGLPQIPTGTLARSVIYFLHVLVPVAAVALYILHRRAGPDIQWKWGYVWGGAVGAFVVVMIFMHSYDPRTWYAKGSPEGERYFEPSKARTKDGKFIAENVLMMDQYCLKCHADAYNGWFHSAHHFSSFNNKAYLASVRETRASSRLPAKKFSKEDLPTFDRPMNANSGNDSSGHESRSGALRSKMADEMFTINGRLLSHQTGLADITNFRE